MITLLETWSSTIMFGIINSYYRILRGEGGIRYMDMYAPVLKQLFSRYMYTVN